MRNISLHCLAGPLKNQTFRLSDGPVFIFGRYVKSSFSLAADPAASHLHFLIDTSEGRVRIIDLGSTNGLVINEKHMGGKQGTPFRDFVQLKSGDTVLAGACLFRLSVTEASTARHSAGPTAVVRGAGARNTRTSKHLTAIIQKDISARLAARSREQAGAREGVLPGIAGYTLLERIAVGGKSIVFRAIKDDSGAATAIKMLTPQWSEKHRAFEMFRREIEIVKRMQHVNIIRYLGDGVSDGQPYLAIEFIDGGSMDGLISSSPARRLDVEQAVPLFLQLLEAVAYMHNQSLVHRDINPKNILMDVRRGGSLAVKLSDMGLSCQASVAGTASSSGSGEFPSIAIGGGGALAFMPPERLTDVARALPESDVFSAAATFFHMVTGESPYAFDDRDQNETIIAGNIKSIADMRPDLPGRTAGVIEKALSHIPENRYANAQEFLDAFQEALG